MKTEMLAQETEATFIKEDELRHNWTPAHLRRWQQAVARRDSLRQEMAALTAGAPASSAREERSQVGSTEGARSLDNMEQAMSVLKPDSLETAYSPGGGQPSDDASSMPPGTKAEVQTEGCVAGVQPCDGEPDTVQPAGTLHQSPETQQSPEPEGAQATMPSAGTTDTETDSEGGHSAESEVICEEGPDGHITWDPEHQVPDTWVMHDRCVDGLDADNRALFHAVRLGNCREVERLLDAGCDVDVQDAVRHTLLHTAARSEYLICKPVSESMPVYAHFHLRQSSGPCSLLPLT